MTFAGHFFSLRHKVFFAPIILGVLLAAASSAHAAPAALCLGVDRSLGDNDKEALEPVVAEQTEMEDVELLESYQAQGWRILYVDAPEIDPAFLFYSGDPKDDEYITQWNGAVHMDKEEPVKEWLAQHMPDMPEELASCFAERVVAGK